MENEPLKPDSGNRGDADGAQGAGKAGDGVPVPPKGVPGSDPCPRCGADTAGREACPRCGLGREHRERFAAETALPPELAAKWEAVLAAWDDPAPHALFLEACTQGEALDLAAARYRPLTADPERAERAGRALDRIVARAEEELRRGATPRDRVRRNRWITLAIAAVVTVAFLVVIAVAILSR